MTLQHGHIITSQRKVVCALNLTSQDVNILDVIHAMPLQVMFSGQMRKFYSKAEHLSLMFDLLDSDTERYINILYNKKQQSKNPVMSVKRKKLLLFCLLYYAGDTYLNSFRGDIENYDFHNNRTVSAIVGNLGEDWKEYKYCKDLIAHVDKEVKTEIIASHYHDISSQFGKYPIEAMGMYIERFNSVTDMGIRQRGQVAYSPRIPVQLQFELPTVSLY